MSTQIDPMALDPESIAARGGERRIRQPRMRFGKWLRVLGWRHLVGIAIVIFATFPLIYVLSASLNPGGTLTGSNQLFRALSLDNYVQLLSDERRPYAAWFGNTLIVGIVTSLGTVLLGALAAYAFSRMRFRGRRQGLFGLILVQMFPQLLAVVAIYALMRGISQVFPAIGLDTLIGLIMVYLGGALGVNTYLMYGFFNTVPASIDEAAKIDGAGHARIFFTIILPLVAPILAVIGLLSFIGTTNDFLLASVILNEPRQAHARGGPVPLRLGGDEHQLPRLRSRGGARRHPGDGAVPLPAEVHRQRTDRRRRQVADCRACAGCGKVGLSRAAPPLEEGSHDRHEGTDRPRSVLEQDRLHHGRDRLSRGPRQHLALPLRRLRGRRRGVHPALPGGAAGGGHPAAAARLRRRPLPARLRPAVVRAHLPQARVDRLVAGRHLRHHRRLLRRDPGVGHPVHRLLLHASVGRRPGGVPVHRSSCRPASRASPCSSCPRC